MANEHFDDQGLLVDELEMSNKVGGQGNSYLSGNIVTPIIRYNKNMLAPMKYH